MGTKENVQSLPVFLSKKYSSFKQYFIHIYSTLNTEYPYSRWELDEFIKGILGDTNSNRV